MRFLSLAVILLLAAASARAEERKLTTDEIQAVFAGNSVHGQWGKTEYYSFFGVNGLTTYTTRQGTDRGHWHASNDQYCSVWQMSGESCYDILQDGDQIIWVLPSSGKRYPSTLIPGDAPPIFE
jgi:hypothetical protein